MDLTTIIMSLILGAIGSLIAADFYARAETWAAKLVNLAVRRLPEQLQAEQQEEWLANMLAIKSNMQKLWFSLSVQFSAMQMVRITQPAIEQRRKNGAVGYPNVGRKLQIGLELGLRAFSHKMKRQILQDIALAARFIGSMHRFIVYAVCLAIVVWIIYITQFRWTRDLIEYVVNRQIFSSP